MWSVSIRTIRSCIQCTENAINSSALDYRLNSLSSACYCRWEERITCDLIVDTVYNIIWHEVSSILVSNRIDVFFSD
jgi:hypothetical protein